MQKLRKGAAGWVLLATAGCVSGCGNDNPEGGSLGYNRLGLASAQVVAVSRTMTSKGVRIERKLLLPDGSVHGDVVDEAGRTLIDEPAPPKSTTQSTVITPALAARLAAGSAPPLVDILMARVDTKESAEPDSIGEADANGINVDGVQLDEPALQALQAADAKRLEARREDRVKERTVQLVELDKRTSLRLSEAQIRAGAEQGSLALPLEVAQIVSLTRESDIVAALDLHVAGEDDSFATARTATSTRSVDLISGVTGNGVGIYMTETGCPPAGFIDNYTLLAGSDTSHSHNVSSIVRGVSPDSWLYCRGGGELPLSTDLPGTGGHAAIHLITRSYGGTLANSAYDSYTSGWDEWIYDNRISVVQAAGNAGASTGNLAQVSMGLNVATIANYQDSNSTINSTSSYLDPTSKNAKPELSAPGTSIDAGGATFTGTSQATPFASAITADIMSAYTWLKFRPALTRAVTIAAATDAISGGYDAVGYGGIDYLSGYYSVKGFWWEGGNSSFASWDAGDITPNNGTLDGRFTISSAGARVHVVLCWLNRGSWTFAHLGDPHPIGFDLDISVTDPSDNYVGSSTSWDDSAEVVNFTSATSGSYSIHVSQYADRDTSSNLVIGVAVNADY